jgi:hypothetical protein
MVVSKICQLSAVCFVRQHGIYEVERSLRSMIAASREHGDGCAGTIRILVRPHPRGISERDGVIEVHGLTFSLGAIGVDQDNLRCQAAQQQGISECRAYIADTDDGNSRGTGMWARFAGHFICRTAVILSAVSATPSTVNPAILRARLIVRQLWLSAWLTSLPVAPKSPTLK